MDNRVFELMCTYIDSTDGLPLGYQTSQLLALMYLDEFDHWVKETLHARYYGRYMDDFYIIHEDKAHLQKCLALIRERMDALKLELNGKTAIFPLKNGINFLGFHTYLDSGGKVIMKLRRDSIDRMKARIRAWRVDYPAGKVSRDKIITSWRAWDAHASHGDTYTLRQKIAAPGFGDRGPPTGGQETDPAPAERTGQETDSENAPGGQDQAAATGGAARGFPLVTD